MRPTFMGFETAKSAIFVNQKALDITGNNMANEATPGYTRQRVTVTSVGTSSLNNRVSGSRVGLAGQGVEALGVSQMRDAFLDKRFRDEYTKTGYHGKAADVLNDLQSALGDGQDISDTSGLFGAITQIFNSINDFVPNATEETQANLVMAAFKNATQVLQQLDAKVQNVAKQQIYDLGLDVGRINDIAGQVAALNEMIAGDSAVASNPDNEHFRPNELMDQRNLLLDELSSFGDISVQQMADGTINIQMGGQDLVSGKEFNQLYLQEHEEGTVELKWRGSGENISLSGGSVLASLSYINGRGNNMQSAVESPEKGILYYRDRIDTFANALAKIANNTVPEMDPTTKEPKLDENGQIVYKTLLGAKMPDGSVSAKAQVTAGNITISDEWIKGGSGYFIYNKEENVPIYAQKIVSALTSSSSTFQSGGSTFTGSFEEYLNDYVSTLATDLNYQVGRQEATAKVADDFLNRRDVVSGVSKDEETTNMLNYQKSFEAAARLLTTLDEILDILINRTGRVGL